MPRVLTVGSTITCVHQGTVTAAPTQQKLVIDGQPALVLGNLGPAPVAPLTCVDNPATGQKHCTTVSMVGGAAPKLIVDGRPVLLETAAGTTDSSPPGTFSVHSAGQTKLTAS